MEIPKKLAILTTVLLILSIYITIYTFSAYSVASKCIVETDNGPAWKESPPGTLFPWPKESGNKIILPVLVELNSTDKTIYLYFVKSGVLLGLNIALWGVSLVFVRHLVRSILKISKEDANNNT